MLMDLKNNYWFVGGNEAQVFSSSRSSYVPSAEAVYLAWLAVPGNFTSRIGSEAELWDLLIDHAPESATNGMPDAVDRRKDRYISQLDDGSAIGIVLRLLFNHENRIRSLASQPQITMAQYKAAIKNLL
jgi:hypothetical protein